MNGKVDGADRRGDKQHRPHRPFWPKQSQAVGVHRSSFSSQSLPYQLGEAGGSFLLLAGPDMVR